MVIGNIFGCNSVNHCHSSLLVLQKNMDLPANVLPILVIILCIFLAVALVGLTYCLNYWCVTRKKKNEVSPISRVEKRFETIPDSKLPKNNTRFSSVAPTMRGFFNKYS